MIAVADASPLCYLVLIGEIDLLPKLFVQVIVPQAVIAELLHEDAPAEVRHWASNPPSWISTESIADSVSFLKERLQAASAQRSSWPSRSKATSFFSTKRLLAVSLRNRLRVAGLLGVLGEAATRDIVDLPSAIHRLRNRPSDVLPRY